MKKAITPIIFILIAAASFGYTEIKEAAQPGYNFLGISENCPLLGFWKDGKIGFSQSTGGLSVTIKPMFDDWYHPYDLKETNEMLIVEKDGKWMALDPYFYLNTEEQMKKTYPSKDAAIRGSKVDAEKRDKLRRGL